MTASILRKRSKLTEMNFKKDAFFIFIRIQNRLPVLMFNYFVSHTSLCLCAWQGNAAIHCSVSTSLCMCLTHLSVCLTHLYMSHTPLYMCLTHLSTCVSHISLPVCLTGQCNHTLLCVYISVQVSHASLYMSHTSLYLYVWEGNAAIHYTVCLHLSMCLTHLSTCASHISMCVSHISLPVCLTGQCSHTLLCVYISVCVPHTSL